MPIIVFALLTSCAPKAPPVIDISGIDNDGDMNLCEEVQTALAETRIWQNRPAPTFTGRCRVDAAFANAPLPNDALIVLDNARPFLERCAAESHLASYQADFRIRVRTTFGGNAVDVLNSSIGEHWISDDVGLDDIKPVGLCMIDVLERTPLPEPRGAVKGENGILDGGSDRVMSPYTIIWMFTYPIDPDRLNGHEVP